jgi:hypothetical protein
MKALAIAVSRERTKEFTEAPIEDVVEAIMLATDNLNYSRAELAASKLELFDNETELNTAIMGCRKSGVPGKNVEEREAFVFDKFKELHAKVAECKRDVILAECDHDQAKTRLRMIETLAKLGVKNE